MSDKRKHTELWIGWPDGENPTVCENYDLGCEKFIEYAAIAEKDAEIEQLKAELKILKNPSDGRCMEIGALRERRSKLEAENFRLKEALGSIVKRITFQEPIGVSQAVTKLEHIKSIAKQTLENKS